MLEPTQERTGTAGVAARVAWAWLPAFAYMALIWSLSSMPIVLPMPSLPLRDKLAHVIEYGALGLLSARAMRRTWPLLGSGRALLAAALFTVVWGYTDEVHQAFVPGRDSNAFDLLADAIGAMAGVGLYAALGALRARSRRA